MSAAYDERDHCSDHGNGREGEKGRGRRGGEGTFGIFVDDLAARYTKPTILPTLTTTSPLANSAIRNTQWRQTIAILVEVVSAYLWLGWVWDAVRGSVESADKPSLIAEIALRFYKTRCGVYEVVDDTITIIVKSIALLWFLEHDPIGYFTERNFAPIALPHPKFSTRT